MKKIKLIIVGIIVAITSIQLALGQKILIRNVNVIDVVTGTLQKSKDIHIENGVIVSINKTKKRKREDQYITIIDGTNKYLMPGFIDTHVHLAMGPVGISFEDNVPVISMEVLKDLPKISAELLLKYGITTSRDPGGKTDVTVKTKQDLAVGKLKGPEFLVAGSILDTTKFENLVVTVTNEKELREEIRKQKEIGVDYIKLYASLTPELTKIGIEESHKLGLRTISHLHTTSWTEASNLGTDNIVHIIPGHERYLPEAKREAFHQVSMMGAIGIYKWFEYVDLESKEISELIQTLKSNGTSIDPTLVVFHATFFGNTGEYQANKMLNELPAELINNWRNAFNFNLGWEEIHFTEAQKVWPKVQQFVKLLHTNDVLLTAGTDANNPWIVPGDSFHKELSLLKDCGLSNAEVLKIATLNGAKLLEIDDRTGSIEEGKEADLVLLNSNPLDDIQNSSDISMILLNGKVAN